MTAEQLQELDRHLAVTAAMFADEEREAAEEEIREAARDEALREAASKVFSVRLPPSIHQAVKEVAAREHVGPTTLLRQWVTERVERETDTTGDVEDALTTLRQDVERVARLYRRAS